MLGLFERFDLLPYEFCLIRTISILKFADVTSAGRRGILALNKGTTRF